MKEFDENELDKLFEEKTAREDEFNEIPDEDFVLEDIDEFENTPDDERTEGESSQNEEEDAKESEAADESESEDAEDEKTDASKPEDAESGSDDDAELGSEDEPDEGDELEDESDEGDESEDESDEEDEDREEIDFDKVVLRKDMRKKPFKIMPWLIGTGVVAAVIVFLMYGMNLNIISVSGNIRYTDEEIIGIVGNVQNYDNTWTYYLKHRKVLTDDIALVDAIEVKMKNLHTILINVDEKQIVGCVKNGEEYLCFDQDGKFIVSMVEKERKVPEVVGITVGSLSIGSDMSSDEKQKKELLTMTSLLNTYGIIVDEVTVAEDGTYSLQIGTVSVALGKGNSIEDKIGALNGIYPKFDEYSLSGTLHLENYDQTQQSIVFNP